MTNWFDLNHDLDLWIFKVKCDLDLWPHTWPWPRIFMVKFLNSCISEWEGRLTLNKGGGSRSFMTMTVTIWWPRSGVRIYQIVIDQGDFRCQHAVNSSGWLRYMVRLEKGWLTDVSLNSWWHTKCAQHAVHTRKFEKMGYLMVAHKNVLNVVTT